MDCKEETPVAIDRVRRAEITVLEEITSNQAKYPVDCNYILFQNVGNTVAKLDFGFSIFPGGVHSFGHPGTYDIIKQDFQISFGDTAFNGDDAPVNRLEVIIGTFKIS
jgi:hypothetical protein